MAGRSVGQIAAELGRTPRGVRDALHRNDIPLPSVYRVEHVDWDAVADDWRSGIPVRDIAARHRIGVNQVTYRFKGSPRVPLPSASKFPQLNDAAWIRGELALGTTVPGIGRLIGASKPAVIAALRRNNITVPPRSMTRLERIAALPTRRERRVAAERLIAELQAQIAAARRFTTRRR